MTAVLPIEAQTREELSKVSSLVLTARKILASGTLVDLAALQERVAGIVASVETMPRENGQALIDDMQALIRRLERLGEDLQEQLDQTTARLGDDGAPTP